MKNELNLLLFSVDVNGELYFSTKEKGKIIRLKIGLTDSLSAEMIIFYYIYNVEKEKMKVENF